jgi:hypothetical protein
MGGGGRSRVPEPHDLIGLRLGAATDAAFRAAVDLPGLWRTPSPGPECGTKPCHRRGEFRRLRLWRGRLWLGSYDRSETGLDEAGNQHGTGLETSEAIWIGRIERCGPGFVGRRNGRAQAPASRPHTPRSPSPSDSRPQCGY